MAGVFFKNNAKGDYVKDYVDSLVNQYKTGDSKGKLDAALPILSLYYSPNFRKDQVKPFLDEIELEELIEYLEKAELEYASSNKVVEIKLLRYRAGLDTLFPSALVNDLTKEQLAVYYYAQGKKHESFRVVNWGKGKIALKKCISIAENAKGLEGLHYWALQFLGTHYYKKRDLDSALIFFRRQLQVAEQLGEKCHYSKCFGVHINGFDDLAHIKMNIGLCLDKAGKLFDAIPLYEEGIKGYQKVKSIAGVSWGRSQLTNAYLDLGDYAHAKSCIKQSIDYWKRNDVPFTYDNGYLRSMLGEFDYYDLLNSAPIIDSIFQFVKSGHKGVGVHEEYYFYSKANLFSMRQIAASIAGNILMQREIIDSIASFKKQQFVLNATDIERHITIQNSIHAILLAWKVALDANNRKNNFSELQGLLKKGDQLISHAVPKLVWLILHANHRHKEELALINTELGPIKNNDFVIESRNIHFQISKAYKHLGRMDSAYYHYMQYDSLRRITQSLNYHAQLSELDKKLEVEKERTKAANLEQLNMELNSKRNRWIMIGFGSTLIMILVIALFVLSRKRSEAQKQRRIAELALLQKENEQKEHALQNTMIELVKSNTNFGQLMKNINDLTGQMKVETKKKARSILLDFRAELQNDTWKKFNLEFENANAGFNNELRRRYNGITDSELRISAMHVSGLSNKEISAITGQQLSSLHTHKSRLRKKLGVESDEELLKLLETLKTA